MIFFLSRIAGNASDASSSFLSFWSALLIHYHAGLGHILFVLVKAVRRLGKFAFPLENVDIAWRNHHLGVLGVRSGCGGGWYGDHRVGHVAHGL